MQMDSKADMQLQQDEQLYRQTELRFYIDTV